MIGKRKKCVYSVRRGVTREAAPLPFASVLKENLNKDLNPMVDEQNVLQECLVYADCGYTPIG